MFRIGLMGCGMVADYGHLPSIVATPGLTLASLYDPSEEHLAAAAAKFGKPAVFTDVDAFFRSGIDAVVVTSPAPVHRENVRDAARYGKHVLWEKSLAMTDQDAEAMILAMHDAGKLLVTGFCYRFSPSALEIRDLIASGAIGELRAMRLIYIWNLHGKYQKDANGTMVLNERRVGRMLEGGPMVDCGVHQIDLARWWTGSEVIREVCAAAWIEDYEAPDHMWLHLDHESGVHSMVEMSFAYNHTATEPVVYFSYDLIGTEGVIRYDREADLFDVRSSRGTQRLQRHHEKDFDGMYAAFARALETGDRGNLPSGEDGLIATRIARRATEEVIRTRLRPAKT